ncbi:MAG TPA: hypothetical protein VFR47_11765 [Anaerolineales bacterium]|nr:hypothetical protein [Anaerolineales bacterium]
MEILISALEKTLSYLRNSHSSDWASMPVEEIIEELESEIAKAGNSGLFDAKRLSFLFAPTGVIQETSIDNGWGDEFIRISNIVDQFTNTV